MRRWASSVWFYPQRRTEQAEFYLFMGPIPSHKMHAHHHPEENLAVQQTEAIAL